MQTGSRRAPGRTGASASPRRPRRDPRSLNFALGLALMASLLPPSGARAAEPTPASHTTEVKLRSPASMLAEMLQLRARSLGGRAMRAMAALQRRPGRRIDQARLDQIRLAVRKIAAQLQLRSQTLARASDPRADQHQRRALEYLSLRLNRLRAQLQDCAADVLPRASVEVENRAPLPDPPQRQCQAAHKPCHKETRISPRIDPEGPSSLNTRPTQPY